VAVGVLVVAACSCNDAPPPPSASPGDPAVAEARQVFAARCAPCHGPDGRGNGPASGSLVPRPRDFHDKDWQAQVTNEHIERIIKLGGPSVGKSAVMPANPDLVDKPAVVAGLRHFVRGLSQD
jgi:mono/diheme cytochrome c family protein